VSVIRSVPVILLAFSVHPDRLDVVREGGCKTPLLLYSLGTRIFSPTD